LKNEKQKPLLHNKTFTVSNAVAFFQEQQFQWPCSSRNDGFKNKFNDAVTVTASEGSAVG
jgi:hypothetical protein